MKVFATPAANVNIKLLIKVLFRNMFTQFMKVSVIHVANVIIKQLLQVV